MQRYLTVVEHQPIPVKSGVITLLGMANTKHSNGCGNINPQYTRAQKLRLAGLAKYFSHITSGDEVTNGKPAPEIYLLRRTAFTY